MSNELWRVRWRWAQAGVFQTKWCVSKRSADQFAETAKYIGAEEVTVHRVQKNRRWIAAYINQQPITRSDNDADGV